MIPETKNNKTIELYKSHNFPYKWEFQKNLMESISAVDSSLFFYNNKWWLFSNIAINEGDSTWDSLYLFYADNFMTDSWNPHPLNPIVKDLSSARPAGRIYMTEDGPIRPSQNCEQRYGYSINLNKIVTLNENSYEEILLEEIKPKGINGLRGTHTFNYEDDIYVTDGLIRRKKYK